jgi:hypothetical protein
VSFVLVKPKKEVCEERATEAASRKFDHLIDEKRASYSKSKNAKDMQKVIQLSRMKKQFYSKAFKHYMDNYEIAKDSVAEKMPENLKKKINLKSFTDYLIEQLSNI